MIKIRLIILLGIILTSVSLVNACDITLKIQDEAKEAYHVGDDLIVQVDLLFTHINGSVSERDSKLKCMELKIIDITDWKKILDMQYARRLKVKAKKVTSESTKTQTAAKRAYRKEGVGCC
ncbi:hypothetical protein [Plebeiibacterium sediminum]|uniref:Uncharacterized protein n=1 Tax=Plebeiibacterium sediminum TaxID=2992112 RepID=A0AAE3M3C6_9BACT|nr:hypothetical protein [Plebeiobacterium sediminum]MCW3786010.1 hypothetical protein [Plebeiobacterium sediminum]